MPAHLERAFRHLCHAMRYLAGASSEVMARWFAAMERLHNEWRVYDIHARAMLAAALS